MVLTCYRPPFHDELLYGWLQALAEYNYPMDPLGTQRVVDRLFAAGKEPANRGVVSKEPIRKDFLMGIDASVRSLQAQGYVAPDTADIITYNTPLVVLGIVQSKGDQARFIHTAVSTVTGGTLDMPDLPKQINKIQLCPICMRNEPYIRTWHNLPGVESCADHGVDLCTLKEWNQKRDDTTITPSSSSKKQYARFVKEIYEHPSNLNIQGIRSFMLAHNMGLVRSRHALFPCTINSFIESGVPYADIISRHCTKPYFKRKSAWLISKTGTIGVFQCKACGNIWTDAIEAVQLGFGCPSCQHSASADLFVARMLHGIGDGHYRLDGPFLGMGATQVVIHDTCGRTHPTRITNIIWNRPVCPCEKNMPFWQQTRTHLVWYAL